MLKNGSSALKAAYLGSANISLQVCRCAVLMGSDTLPVLYGSLSYGREGCSRFIYSTCAQALTPPSTVRFAPLMYDDSGPATNATSAATSSTRPYRSSGTTAFWPDRKSVV